MATSIVETITPKKALEYLATSGGNRNISKAVVESYSTSMKKGKWLLNGEPIVFDMEGRLLNGHHRLHAVIKADTPIQTFVTRGVEHECFTTYDCGRHRSVGQLVGMQGVKNYNVVGAAVQFSYRLEHGFSVTEANATKRVSKTNSDMIARFNADRERFIEAANFAVAMRAKANILQQSMVAGTYYFLISKLGWDKETVSYFFEQICSMDSSENHVLNEFRKRAVKNAVSKKEKLNQNVLFALLIKAFNYYTKGKTVKILSFDPEKENYPIFNSAN